ncbi:hypothetical protein ACIHFD_61590 [Nonomuraea sp. NPDC051941]|uniref:hypothetical protein n=1 Tax=Nonomuraea sp. NPDC051941 TaxID=3364373 RepID=UPI0037C6B323
MAVIRAPGRDGVLDRGVARHHTRHDGTRVHPASWAAHLRHTVRFSDALRTLLTTG